MSSMQTFVRWPEAAIRVNPAGRLEAMEVEIERLRAELSRAPEASPALPAEEDGMMRR